MHAAVLLPAPLLPVDAVLAELRAEGPVFHADHGRWSTVGALSDVGPVAADTWRSHARRAMTRTAAAGAPFQPGCVGWFGYETGAWMDRVASDARPTPLPAAWLGNCDAAYTLGPAGASVTGWPDAAHALLRRLSRLAPSAPSASPPRGRRVPHEDRAAYEAGVRTVRAHLRAGDCYQVNLARRIDVEDAGDPLHAWLRLRARNRARRALFVETADGAVVSNSPELLLRVDPTADATRALSVPIKGTAARVSGERPDALLRSPKERAELTMIVDLVRADLGRVAVPGSVRAGPRRVGAVGHVWHAMQRVWCDVAPGHDAADAFSAVFPAGSVTGAPRIRATQVIQALERGPRGVYCGALGWFGAGGHAWWNVAIRTITFARGAASFHVGAGIVLGSDPAREYDETELKAARMAEALCG